LALEHPDHAGAADPAMHLDAPLLQSVGDDARGADLLEADFGMRVQILADRDEFIDIAFDTADVRHVRYLAVVRGWCADVRLVIVTSASRQAIRSRMASYYFRIASLVVVQCGVTSLMVRRRVCAVSGRCFASPGEPWPRVLVAHASRRGEDVVPQDEAAAAAIGLK